MICCQLKVNVSIIFISVFKGTDKNIFGNISSANSFPSNLGGWLIIFDTITCYELGTVFVANVAVR